MGEDTRETTRVSLNLNLNNSGYQAARRKAGRISFKARRLLEIDKRARDATRYWTMTLMHHDIPLDAIARRMKRWSSDSPMKIERARV